MVEKLVTIVLRARGVRRVPPLRITSIQTSSSARIWYSAAATASADKPSSSASWARRTPSLSLEEAAAAASAFSSRASSTGNPAPASESA